MPKSIRVPQPTRPLRPGPVRCFLLLAAAALVASPVPRVAAGPVASGRTVEGVVAGADGRPVFAADVAVVALNYHRPFGDDHPLVQTRAQTLAQGKAGRDGRFRLTVPAPREGVEIALEVFARGPGAAVGWQDLDGSLTAQSVTIALRPERLVRGQALDAEGRPAAGVDIAPVTLRELKPDAQFPFWKAPPDLTAFPPAARTGPDGRFVVAGVPSGAELVLEVRDERFARQRRVVAVGADDPPHVIRLAPPRRVEGSVVFRDSGQPAAGARLVFSSESADLGGHVDSVEARTDGRGRFDTAVYDGDTLKLAVLPPQPGGKYRPLERSIPWVEGTTTQRMTLPLYSDGTEPVDGTTPDGRPASTIEADTPAAAVEHRRPEPVPADRPADRLAGTLVVSGSFVPAAPAAGPAGRVRGIVAVDPGSGRWRLLARDARAPRVSPDGKHLAYLSADRDQLHVVPLGPESGPGPAEARAIAGKCVAPAQWLPAGDAVVANLHAPARRDYHGEEYWGQESKKWVLGLDGRKLREVPVPPLYDVYDVSPDGRWLAMHWDTHATLTGAQLYVSKADGSGLRPVARKRSQYYWYPRFSPDGQTLLAKHLDPGSGEITVRLLAVDGSRERAFHVGDGLMAEAACWSPDGRAVAVVALSEDRRVCRLRVISVDGTRGRDVELDGCEEVRADDVTWTAVRLVPE